MPAAGQRGTELQQKWKAYKEAVLARHGRTVDDHLTRESSGLDLGTKNALLELQNAHMREKVEEAAVRSTADRQLIESLRCAMEGLPSMIKQGVVQALGTAGNHSFHAQRVCAAATQAAAQPGQPTAGAAKVDIPIPSVDSGLKSMESTWGEWKEGTASRPSICKLYQDHGREWMQKKYGYNKQAWKHKRNLVCAVIALKNIECIDYTAALKVLKTKMMSGVLQGCTGLSRFAEKLPSLDADIHPDGKHTVTQAGVKQITTDHAQL